MCACVRAIGDRERRDAGIGQRERDGARGAAGPEEKAAMTFRVERLAPTKILEESGAVRAVAAPAVDAGFVGD